MKDDGMLEAARGPEARLPEPGRSQFGLRTSRFVLRIGPGLGLAVLAIAVLWPRLQPLASGDRRPAAVPVAPVPAAPDLPWLLDQQKMLHLTAEQAPRLEQLRRRWDRDTLPLRDQLDQATASFRQQMPPSGGGLSLGEIQDRAEPVSALSGKLAAARHRFWVEAARLLTAQQRQNAEAAWNRRLSGRRERAAP